jgi:hypothetical protein
MAHINSIGAGMFSDLAVCMPSSTPDFASLNSAVEFQALFATEINSSGGTKGANTFVRIKNVREFPSIGTPPNVVNVPVYGQATSQQVQGQSDAPTMEITLNFVPSEWAQEAGNLLGMAVGDGNQYVFRFTLMNSEPTGAVAGTKYASTVGGIGTVQNSQWYWVGKLDALLANPQLTDANTATVTITLQSDVFGAYTI